MKAPPKTLQIDSKQYIVAEAQGGVAQLAEAAKLNRESLYRMLSDRGNPEFRSLDALLHALGFRLSIAVEDRR